MSALVASGPNHHQRIIGRASAGGSANVRRKSVRLIGAEVMILERATMGWACSAPTLSRVVKRFKTQSGM
jgi:hypothetical protein